MAEDFRKLAAKGSGQFGTAGLVNPSCPVCEVRWNAEDGLVSAMAQRLQKNPESASTVSVCVPHLQFLCNAIGNSSIRLRLLLREAAVMERTAEDMQRYAIKHDALRRHLASQEENAARFWPCNCCRAIETSMLSPRFERSKCCVRDQGFIAQACRRFQPDLAPAVAPLVSTWLDIRRPLLKTRS